MVLARPARHFAAQERDGLLLPVSARRRAIRLLATWPRKRIATLIANIRTSRRAGIKSEGHEVLEGVLNLLHLDRLVEDDEAVVGGQALAEVVLLDAEQDEGDELMAVFVGALVHVEKRVERVGVLAVGVEDDGIDRSFAIALGGDLGVGDQQHLVAHVREGLAEGVLDFGLGFDAQDALGRHGLGRRLGGWPGQASGGFSSSRGRKIESMNSSSSSDFVRAAPPALAAS